MSYTLSEYDPDADFDRWYTDETGRMIRDRLIERQDQKVLEVGCATGRMTQILISSNFSRTRQIVAVTLDAAMLERAQLRDLPGVIWVEGDVMKLQRVVFDAIVCSLVLHEVPSVGSMLRKFHDLLAPGGRVYVTVPSAGSVHFEGRSRELSERARRFGVQRQMMIGEWHTAMIDGTGFGVAERCEMMLKPYPNEQMADLAPEVLDFLAAYRGPGGALCYFELEARL